jgi:alkaline phosphatase
MNQNGFFLLIEGGRIDHAHHSTTARYALEEFVEFDNAIGQAKHILQQQGVLDDSLLVVTADHSHVFTFGAYSARGSNILGLSTSLRSDIDQLPINIIAYGNGQNFNSPRNATYFSSLDTNSTEYLSPTALPLSSETHSGEDGAVFTQGPWSHLFTGTMEQHTIPHKIAYAACFGNYTNRNGCQSTTTVPPPIFNGINSFYQFHFITMIYFYSFLNEYFL